MTSIPEPLHSYISDKKTRVQKTLEEFRNSSALGQLTSINRWGHDAKERLLTLSVRGKMIRAALVFLGYESNTDRDDMNAVTGVAAALELCHTAFLIQDDVMDNDEKRRGMPSIHTQYNTLFEKDGTNNPKKTGESLSTCLSDIGFFLGFHLLSSTVSSDNLSEMIRLFAKELSVVAVAQMQDVYGGNTKKQFTKEDILKLYETKTGRYTCALPLVAGARLAGAPDNTEEKLWKFGTLIGTLFQLQDDYLNCFGNEEQTGKPVGSDIREGKQTLYRAYLLDACDEKEKQFLQTIYGNSEAASADIQKVTAMLEEKHITDDIQTIMQKKYDDAMEILRHLPLRKETQDLFPSLLTFIMEREQ